MFTGLVEEVGVVRALERRGRGGQLAVTAQKVLEGTRLGDSIAVSGACLTVIDLSRDGFTVDCMPETLSLTTLGSATRGTLVNLERSMQLGGRLGGHLVLGHVDAVAEVLAVQPKDTAWEITLSIPGAIRSCVAAKGSVAIDGISLTVIRVEARSFEIGIIPHTLQETTLKSVKVGQRVNLEVDVLARYVQRALLAREESEDSETDSTRGLTEDLLRKQGFA